MAVSGGTPLTDLSFNAVLDEAAAFAAADPIQRSPPLSREEAQPAGPPPASPAAEIPQQNGHR